MDNGSDSDSDFAYDYNENTSDEECDPDLWEEEKQEEKKEITYQVCFIDSDFIILIFSLLESSRS